MDTENILTAVIVGELGEKGEGIKKKTLIDNSMLITKRKGRMGGGRRG